MLGWHYLQHLVWWSCQFYFLLFLIIYLFFSNSYRIAEQIFVLILSVLSCSWFCCLFFTKQFVVPVNHDCFSIGNVIILLINFFSLLFNSLFFSVFPRQYFNLFFLRCFIFSICFWNEDEDLMNCQNSCQRKRRHTYFTLPDSNSNINHLLSIHTGVSIVPMFSWRSRDEVDIQLWSLEWWIVGASQIYMVLKCSDVNSSCFKIVTALLTRMCLNIFELASRRNIFHVQRCFENYSTCWVSQNLSATGEIKALSLCTLRYL